MKTILLALCASALFGQTASQTWVSGVGDDANSSVSCTRVAPCATFTGALGVTTPGGEIDVLDPGDFGPVTITQAVTIAAVRAPASIIVTAGTGIVVNAGTGDTVTLQGLMLNGQGTGGIGIQFSGGGVLQLENCEIDGFATAAMELAAGSSSLVNILDSGFHGNVAGILQTSSADVFIRGLQLDQGTNGLSWTTGKVEVEDSYFSYLTGAGLNALSGTNVFLLNSQFDQDNVAMQAASGATVVLSDDEIAFNGTAISCGSGTFQSYNNNRFVENGGGCAPTGLTNPDTTGSPFPLTPQPPAAPPFGFTATPASLSFQYFQGALATSLQQTLNINPIGTATAPWSATASVPWLVLGSTSGAMPGSLGVSASPNGLALGTYNGNVTIVANGVTVTVPVTLSVTPPPPLVVTPSRVSVVVPLGQTVPVTVALQIGAGGAFTIQQGSPSQSWFQVGSSSGSGNARVSVTVDPTNANTGIYYGSLVITSPGAPNSPLSVPVQMSVTGAGLLPASPLANASSFTNNNAVAPNEIVTLFLQNLSCPAGAQVTINGQPQEVIASGSGQITFVASASVGGTVAVTCGGVPVWEFAGLVVAPVLPGIFTVSQNGTGPAAIVNPDGIVNSAAQPAHPGNVIEVYGTGFGSYSAASPDGLRRLSATVTATVGGVPATVLYAGEAPGFTLGLSQIDVVIPASVAPGNLPVVLTVNGVSTQTGVTVTVE